MTEASINRLISMVLTMRHIVLAHAKTPQAINPISLLRLETLRFVDESSRPTMRDLAGYFGITPPSATSLVSGLVAAGRLKRVPDKKDRRVIHLTVTAPGRKACNSGMKKIMDRMKIIFNRLPEKDRLLLINILSKLLKTYNHKQ